MEMMAVDNQRGSGLINTSMSVSLLQRNCACGNHTVAGEECAECRKKRLQRKAANHTEPAEIPPIVNEVLHSPGQPLDPSTRAFLEPRFGYEFSHVRVHTDGKAAESAQAMNALAYTIGKNVVFGTGQYRPHTDSGTKLLAHELVHVVQQHGTYGQASRIGSEDEPAELEAQSVSEHIMRGVGASHLASRQPANGTAQRQVIGDKQEDEDKRHRISVVFEGQPPILSRQRSDIPPPPPAFPHFSQFFLGEVATKIGELEITCQDRRERGFWIFWNLRTKVASVGETMIGKPAPKECEKPARIEFGHMPPDRGDIVVAGVFHNHPPVRPGCTQLEVGPSKLDKATSSKLKLPGLVQDFMKPGPNTSCKGNPRGTFFFGPARREV